MICPNDWNEWNDLNGWNGWNRNSESFQWLLSFQLFQS
jgi:hypothetical protein